LSCERREIFDNDTSDNIEVHIKIAMDETVTRASDFGPRDFGVALPKIN
jgi:hypothetical protein